MNSLILLLEIVLIFILPIVLIYYNIIHKKFRLWGLFGILLSVCFLSYSEHMTLRQLGIRVDNFNVSYLPYSLLTIIGACVILIAAKLLNKKMEFEWLKNRHFQFMFLFVSIAQEFLYRGFLIPKLSLLISSTLIVILINALLFMFLHIIYPNKATNLVFTFIGGVAFATIYFYYPNLILISLSHASFNFFAVLYGLVGFGKKRDFHVDLAS